MIKVASILLLLLSFSYCTSQTSKIDWYYPSSLSDIDSLIQISQKKPIVFYKHSYRCGLCHMIHDDFKKDWSLKDSDAVLVFIEVNSKRDISNYISTKFSIKHHSPQVIVIKESEILYTETHGKIKTIEIQEVILDN